MFARVILGIGYLLVFFFFFFLFFFSKEVHKHKSLRESAVLAGFIYFYNQTKLIEAVIKVQF